MRSFDDMNRLFEELDQTFEQMRSAWMTGFDVQTPPTALETTRPSLDRAHEQAQHTPRTGTDTATTTLTREDGAYLVVMDLPGFETEDIDLTFDDQQLLIAADTQVTRDVETESHHRRSMATRRVHKAVPIPTEIVIDEITASYRNGVLEVRLPIVDDDREGHQIDIE